MVLECEQSHCFLSSNTHTHTGYFWLARAIFLLLDATNTDQTNARTFPNNTLYWKKNPKKYNKIYSLCNLRSFHWTWIQFFLTQCAVHSLIMCKFSFIYMSIQDFQTIFLHPTHPHLSQCNKKIESFIHSLHTFTIYKEPF